MNDLLSISMQNNFNTGMLCIHSYNLLENIYYG